MFFLLRNDHAYVMKKDSDDEGFHLIRRIGDARGMKIVQDFFCKLPNPQMVNMVVGGKMHPIELHAGMLVQDLKPFIFRDIDKCRES